MASHLRVFRASCVVGFAAIVSACSAFVSGALSDSDENQKNLAADASAQKANNEASACALVDANAPNTCDECINTNCSEHVAFACTGEDGGDKPWFSSMQRCATNPDYGDQIGWGCGTYDNDSGVISGEDDSARKRQAELCVRDRCLTGATPACRQCDVTTTKAGSSEEAHLADDPCGACIATKCAAALVRCCRTQVVNEIVASCAHTADEAKKATCNTLGSPDGGSIARSSTEDQECFADLGQCFVDNCASKCQ